MKKKTLSLLLALLMLLSLMPLQSFAENEEAPAPENCAVCGEIGCALQHSYCEICGVHDCHIDHGAEEANEEYPIPEPVPETEEQDNAGSKPEPTGESGIAVCGGNIPEGASLSIAEADPSAELALFGLDEAVFAVDIKVLNEDSSEWQPDSAVLVKIPVDAAVGTKLGLLHTHNGRTSYMGITEVLPDGTVEFYTNGFSEFAGFTVDFHYSGVDFSIAGKSSILLSELFRALGISDNATAASSVVFSSPSLLTLERQANGDWLLTSLKAFETEETLFISFEDGHTILIDVTDALYNKNLSFSNSDVEGHFAYSSLGGRKEIYVHLYSGNSNTSFDVSQKVSSVPSDAWLDMTSSTYWFELKSVSGGMELAWNPYDPVVNILDLLNAHALAFRQHDWFETDVAIHVKCWPRTITDSSNSSFCYIKQAQKFAVSGDTAKRDVEIYLNRNGSNVQVQKISDILFPDRNNDANGHGEINAGRDLSTPTGAPGYRYVRMSDDGNRTYKVYIELIPYTISYNLDGGTLDKENPVSYNTESQSFTLNNPSRPGYTFAGWTGTGLSSATMTVTIPTGSIGDRSYTATWIPNNYGLTFNFNGGVDNSGSTADQEYEVTYGSSNYYDVSWLNPSRSGYKFEGWFTEPEGGTQVYGTDGICLSGSYWNSDKQWIGTAQLTLYAQWTEQYRYVLNFDANGGESAPGSIIADWKDESSHTFTWADTPTRDGYSFMGWAESPDSTENVTGENKNTYTIPGSAAQTAERTLYAIWERQTGAIKLDHEGTEAAIVTLQGKGLHISFVLDKDITISDLPAGTYSISASGASASATAALDNASPVVAADTTTTVKITVSSRSTGWFTGFSRVINSFGG